MDAGLRKPLEALTPAEMRTRAREYQLTAVIMTEARVRNALLQMARMLQKRAAEKEAQGADHGGHRHEMLILAAKYEALARSAKAAALRTVAANSNEPPPDVGS